MKLLTASLSALLALLGSLALAADPPPPAPPPQTSAAPTYVPPLRGAPSRRVGGSTRGVGQAMPVIAVIAPDHVGQTISEQPVLYWFISKPTKVMLEITLIDERGVKPMLELPVRQVEGPAIHALDLSKHGISLKRGMEYQWTVTLVPDAAERSGDVISGGAIKLVDAPPALKGKLGKSGVVDAPVATLAAEGLWYDAIHALSAQIAAQPQNAGLREQRAVLMEQVGLNVAGAFDRKR
jgi:hypothetical protein